MVMYYQVHGTAGQRVRRVEFAELPTTLSGKIRRVELRGNEDQTHPSGDAATRNPNEYLRSTTRLDNRGECIPGMTIHQAKGKEWPAVGVRLNSAQINRIQTGLSETSTEDRAIYVALTPACECARLV